MELGSIYHRCAFADCYAKNGEELVIRIRTGKDITGAQLVWGDPYTAGISNESNWEGERVPMQMTRELRHHFLWEATVRPPYKRAQYYFEIESGAERVFVLEDDCYTPEEFAREGFMKQYFKFAWMNDSDICKVPGWVRDIVWYQIMPDRFARGNFEEKSHPIRDWNYAGCFEYHDFFGGDLAGIIEKLDYLKELGISGIYLTPIFASGSNHKYDTTDYTRIDADFGCEEEMRTLVEQAHARGIRIMVDAVFNHCGTDFFAWKDVCEKGRDSEYLDWFFVNGEIVGNRHADTKDGRYYSFAFCEGMPKLNTNHAAVADYFLGVCRHWVRDWGIDAIRFDVGNEVAHSFLKMLHRELKAINPELFLLGEIWHDAAPWLMGDEYDSVMHYPFVESIENFWGDKNCDTRRLMYGLNYCYSLYMEQTNDVLFQFLDTHDIGRAASRCGSLDAFFQELALLLSMQGTPCLYYGTELALEGGADPDNRRPMPWDAVTKGTYRKVTEQVRQLISLRNRLPQTKSGEVVWHHDDGRPRLVHYEKRHAQGNMEVFLNAGETAVQGIGADEPRESSEGEILFSRKYEDGVLAAGGILIRLKSDGQKGSGMVS